MPWTGGEWRKMCLSNTYLHVTGATLGWAGLVVTKMFSQFLVRFRVTPAPAPAPSSQFLWFNHGEEKWWCVEEWKISGNEYVIVPIWNILWISVAWGLIICFTIASRDRSIFILKYCKMQPFLCRLHVNKKPGLAELRWGNTSIFPSLV